VKDEQHDAGGNADIGHIEDTGAEGANAEVHEVDHAAIVKEWIEEIFDTATEHQTPAG
jgi:hypothetical protein